MKKFYLFVIVLLLLLSSIYLEAQPVNDDACNAIMLSLNADCSATLPYTNITATTQAGELIGSCYGDNSIEQTVWFSFVAPASGAVSISTDFAGSGMQDSQLTLFQLLASMSELIDIEIVEAAVNSDEYEQYFLLVSQPEGTVLEYIKYTDIDVDYLFDLTRRNNGEYSVHSYVAPISFLPAPKLDNIILNGGTLDDVFISLPDGAFCAELDFDGVRTEIANCLRLDQASILDYEIYPNPATDKLHFNNLSLENLVSINITNIRGQVIKEIPYNNKAESMLIDIKDLQSGIYLLNVQTDLKVSSTKFIVN